MGLVLQVDLMLFINYLPTFVFHVAHLHGISKICILLLFTDIIFKVQYDVMALCNINVQ